MDHYWTMCALGQALIRLPRDDRRTERAICS